MRYAIILSMLVSALVFGEVGPAMAVSVVDQQNIAIASQILNINFVNAYGQTITSSQTGKLTGVEIFYNFPTGYDTRLVKADILLNGSVVGSDIKNFDDSIGSETFDFSFSNIMLTAGTQWAIELSSWQDLSPAFLEVTDDLYSGGGLYGYNGTMFNPVAWYPDGFDRNCYKYNIDGDIKFVCYIDPSVPEPSTIVLLCAGLSGLIFWKKKMSR